MLNPKTRAQLDQDGGRRRRREAGRPTPKIFKAKNPCQNRQTSSENPSSSTLKSSTKPQSSRSRWLKTLLLVRERHGGASSSANFPKGLAEDLPVKTDGAAAQRDALRVGNLGHHFAAAVGRARRSPRDTAGRAAAAARWAWRRMVALAFIILRRSGGAELPQKLATGSALAGVMRSARGPSGAALLRWRRQYGGPACGWLALLDTFDAF